MSGPADCRRARRFFHCARSLCAVQRAASSARWQREWQARRRSGAESAVRFGTKKKRRFSKKVGPEKSCPRFCHHGPSPVVTRTFIRTPGGRRKEEEGAGVSRNQKKARRSHRSALRVGGPVFGTRRDPAPLGPHSPRIPHLRSMLSTTLRQVGSSSTSKTFRPAGNDPAPFSGESPAAAVGGGSAAAGRPSANGGCTVCGAVAADIWGGWARGQAKKAQTVVKGGCPRAECGKLPSPLHTTPGSARPGDGTRTGGGWRRARWGAAVGNARQAERKKRRECI